jgi:SAM-dependent methyltransferase
MSQLGWDATGMETSPRALATAEAIAKASGGKQKVVPSPSPAWDGTFDVVCAFDVLEHIADDADALDQWLGWVRPGGWVCLSVPAHRRRWSAGDEWAGHYRRYDRADLLALLASRKLTVEHLECYGFPLANLTERLGNSTYRRLIDARKEPVSPAEASAESGVERSDYVRIFRLMDTIAGRVAIRAALLAQGLTARSNLGSGYLVMARKA